MSWESQRKDGKHPGKAWISTGKPEESQAGLWEYPGNGWEGSGNNMGKIVKYFFENMLDKVNGWC